MQHRHARQSRRLSRSAGVCAKTPSVCTQRSTAEFLPAATLPVCTTTEHGTAPGQYRTLQAGQQLIAEQSAKQTLSVGAIRDSPVTYFPESRTRVPPGRHASVRWLADGYFVQRKALYISVVLTAGRFSVNRSDGRWLLLPRPPNSQRMRIMHVGTFKC